MSAEKQHLVDWRFTEVGRQNWEVCHRMLIHDLVDLNIPRVNKLLAYYHVSILDNGAHTAALPRMAYTKPGVVAPAKKTSTKRRIK